MFFVRSVQEEILDARAYKSRKDNLDLKKKILASYYNPAEEEESDRDEAAEMTEKSKVDKRETKEEEKASKKENKKQPEQKELSATAVKKSNGKPETKAAQPLGSVKEKIEIVENETKFKKKKKNKNIVEQITEERLLAYGINPKKFKKKIKYSAK